MNIAILIPSLGGGGAERVAQIIGDYYIEKGEKVYYFLADTTIKQAYQVKGQIINTGIKGVDVDNSSGKLCAFWKVLKPSLTVRKLKRRYHIDAAISFMEAFNYINLLSKGRDKVITRICTVLSGRDDVKGPLYSKSMLRFLYNHSDAVVVMSDYVKEEMHKNYGISVARMHKIPNPAVRYDGNEIEDKWTYGRRAVICIGRLDSVKQQERIIRAFSYVKSCCEEAVLLILGTGSNKQYLKNLCDKYGISHSVFFIGFIENIGFYLKNSRVFVMASKVEGFPNSMVEAMAHGVPVVTTDSPGACGEIVGRKKTRGVSKQLLYCKYGILTPAMSERVKQGEKLSEEEILLGEGILKILCSEELHEKYVQRSLKRASMYSLEKVMRHWDRLVKGV